jgi:hypothetical protein
MPNACRGKASARLKVQIKNRCVSILAAGVREVDTNVCLEWPLRELPLAKL